MKVGVRLIDMDTEPWEEKNISKKDLQYWATVKKENFCNEMNLET